MVEAAQGRPPLRRPAVMADVAKLSGFSYQTVSRVINDHPNIRPDTKARVLEAIKLLGYRPNKAARALVTRRSAMIGVIGTETGHWGPMSIHRSLEQAGRQAGFLVTAVNLESVTAETFTAAVDHLLGQSVEGIIVIAANDEALQVVHGEQPDVPFVVVEGDLSKARWTAGVDQVGGAALATRHLLDLGHTEVVHVTGPLNWGEARGRLDGWRREIFAAGIRPAEPLHGNWTAASGFEVGGRLLARSEVTAVFVANDQMALGLLRALHEGGSRVPQDVSVVGFDDIPEAAYTIPPLTTVRQDFAAVGRRAIEVLQAAISRRDEDLPRLIDPELVVRASTAPPTRR